MTIFVSGGLDEDSLAASPAPRRRSTASASARASPRRPTCRRSIASTNCRTMPACRGASDRRTKRRGRAASRCGGATTPTARMAGDILALEIGPARQGARRTTHSTSHARRPAAAAAEPSHEIRARARREFERLPEALRRLDAGRDLSGRSRRRAATRSPRKSTADCSSKRQRSRHERRRNSRTMTSSSSWTCRTISARRRACGAARRRDRAHRQSAWLRAFRNVVLTQDWHPHGHSSFASSHPASGRSNDRHCRLWPAGAVAGPLRARRRRARRFIRRCTCRMRR